MQATQEILLTALMLLILTSLLLILEEGSSALSDARCERVRAVAEELKELANSMGLDIDEYASDIGVDACGG